jgi:hypothetical protein
MNEAQSFFLPIVQNKINIKYYLRLIIHSVPMYQNFFKVNKLYNSYILNAENAELQRIIKKK